jgi:putative transposase
VTPETLLRWYRKLIAQKYDGSKAREVGRPRTARDVEQLVVRMAQECNGMSWETFLKVHWGAIAASDSFTVEALTRAGLVRFLVFFVIDLKNRRVKIAGIAPDPDGCWMKQMARNLTDAEDRLLVGT